MAYQVLARKWRPKKFADLVGQEHVVKALVNALDKGRLHHAYLLTGTRGVGKTTIARILAKSLNCADSHQGEPCGVCDRCRQIDSGRYVDLLEIDAASNTGIDNIREVLENAQYAPTQGRYKVYIIDEVHMLSKSAFNAMLKTLEEPPEHVKFILATTDPHKVPITVLSRCLQFVLRNLNVQQVHEHLAHVLQQEQIAYEDAALQLLGRAAMGSMRDALSLLDQAIALGSGSVTEADVRHMIGAVDQSYLYALLAALADGDGQALLAQAAAMAERGVGLDSALSELALLLQRLALVQAVPGSLAASDPEAPRLHHFAARLGAEQLQLYYQCALRGKQDLPLAPDEYAGFVMTLLRMLAFTPLAAAGAPVDRPIHGSQLHDPAPAGTGPTARLPENLPAAEAAGSATTQPVVDLAAVRPPADNPPSDEPPPPEAAADDLPPWEAMPAAALAGDESAAVAAPVPQDEPVLPAHPGHDTASAASVEPAVLPSATEPAPVAAEHALPPLTAESWPQIVAMLAQKLGAVQLFAQHSALADFNAERGELVLALAAEGELTADQQRLQRLGKVLSEAYGQAIQVRTEALAVDSGLETQAMRRVRLRDEARDEARQCLEADAAARALKTHFGAEWLPESLVLKTPS